MFGISGVEFVVIAIVTLLVVGPRQLPDVLRTAGRLYRRLNRFVGAYRTALDDALYDADDLAKKAEKFLEKKDDKRDG